MAAVSAIAIVAGFVLSFGARLPAKVPAPMEPPPSVSAWRERLGRVLGRRRVPPVVMWVGTAALGFYAVLSLRLLFLGMRVGFL